jgi:hypothetical protein
LNRAWTLEVLEFEKKVSKLKLQGFKMRKNGLKPTPKETPIFVKESNPRSKKNHIKRGTCPMPFLILALTPSDVFRNLWGVKGKCILWKVKTSQASSHSPNTYGRHITQHICPSTCLGHFEK